MRKSLGSKRKEMSDEHIAEVTRLFGELVEASRDGAPISRIFRNKEFGYRTITVERPLRDAKGKIVLGTKGKGKGKPQPDASLRDTENVPLSDDVQAYFEREVKPHVPDAWIDADKTKADLDQRTLNARMDTGTSLDIHDPKALYKSYHTTTPQGFDLQISNGDKANRTVR